MVIGIGVDLVEESRVGRILDRWGTAFLGKILSSEELARLPAATQDRIPVLAAAVALKEAASKALGTGWSHGVRWRDVVAQVGPDPAVRLDARAAEVARYRGSEGRTRAVLSREGDLILAEVWLLA